MKFMIDKEPKEHPIVLTSLLLLAGGFCWFISPELLPAFVCLVTIFSILYNTVLR